MFDAALLESRKSRRFGDRKKSLPVAIALHGVVIGAFVGAAAWSTGEPPEPVVPIVFSLPSPPPPPRGSGGHAAAAETHRSEHPRPAIAAAPAFREIPTVSPTTTDPKPEQPEFENPDQDGRPGDLLGKEGGTGDRPVVAGEPGLGDRPIRITHDVKAPVLVSQFEPDYPESMRQSHREGLVILEAVITATGDVEDVRVLKSANPIFDRAASDAVRRWRYRPATLNGRAVSVYLTVTVTFGLHS